MEAWLLYNSADAARNQRNIGFYFDACNKRGIRLRLLLSEEVIAVIRQGKPGILWRGEELAPPDFAVCRITEPSLSEHLEAMGIPVFNNSMVSRICNHKMDTYRYLSRNGIACMDTVYCSTPSDLGGEIPYPYVLKAVDGHGGNGVFLVRDGKEREKAVTALGNTSCVAQAVASDAGKDLRVYVIGKKVIAAMLRTSNSDFRSNFSLGGKVEPYRLSPEEEAQVKRIIDLFDFGFVGVDFVFHRGKAIFNEIEDVVGARMLYQFTDIKPVPLYLDHIVSTLKA